MNDNKEVGPLAAYHKHPVYDTDSHFVVDPITRKLTNMSDKLVLMQYDHNAERFTFEIPRYIEGHDMLLCTDVQVHYTNSNSSNKEEFSSNIYIVDDLQVSSESDDILVGSWLVSNNATMYSGKLAFVMRFACVDPDTNELTYQWFTDVYSAISISKGIYNVDVISEGNEYDILSQWKETISEEASRRTQAIADEAYAKLEEVTSVIESFEKKTESTVFSVNFETGNLEYESPNFTFNVNEETGNLEYGASA